MDAVLGDFQINNIYDCHFHVFASPEKFSMVQTRGYEPPVLSIKDYRTHSAPLGIKRMVLVQPSCYGSDNRYMLEELAKLGPNGCAVVAVSPNVTSQELAQMRMAGAREIRVNAVGGSTLSLAQLANIAPQLSLNGLHVQTFISIGQLPTVESALLSTGLTIVLDHFGSVDSRLGLDQPTMQSLSRMLKTERVWVKLSAAFRISQSAAPYDDLVPFAQALMNLCPDRLVWGSDWPYVHFIDRLTPDFNPLHFFINAIEDQNQRKLLFSDNSKKLYEFE